MTASSGPILNIRTAVRRRTLRGDNFYKSFILLIPFLWMSVPDLASAQHPNYQPTAGYLDVLSAIKLLEDQNTKIDEDTRTKLLDQGQALKRLEESYANGSQLAIKRFAAAEKKSEGLANELKQLNALLKQLEANKKRTQAQVDTFNRYKDNYNARAEYHNKYFKQLAAAIDAENKQLEAKYVAFSSQVKSFTNPPQSQIDSTIQDMVASDKYQATDDGTACNVFINDFAKNIYNYNGFETKADDGTMQLLTANGIIKKIQGEQSWKRIYDDSKWDEARKPFLQAAFKKAAQYAGDGDLVLVGFQSGESDTRDGHIAMNRKGALGQGSPKWNQAGILGLQFPMIGQAGNNVFASKNLTFGITADELKKHGLVIYVLKP